MGRKGRNPAPRQPSKDKAGNYQCVPEREPRRRTFQALTQPPLLSLAGTGTFSRVRIARHKASGKYTALKILKKVRGTHSVVGRRASFERQPSSRRWTLTW